MVPMWRYMEFRRGEGWMIRDWVVNVCRPTAGSRAAQRYAVVRIGHASKEGHRVHAVLMLEDPSMKAPDLESAVAT